VRGREKTEDKHGMGLMTRGGEKMSQDSVIHREGKSEIKMKRTFMKSARKSLFTWKREHILCMRKE